MKKRTSVYFARLFALIALLGAIAAVYFVATNALDEDATKPSKAERQQQQKEEQAEEPKPKIKAATYEVESGDTLTRISYLSGVKVTKLLELNPEIDAQNLTIGQIIKLR
jgi:LysM repeat protein